LRWFALLCETGSTGSRRVRVRGLYRLIRARPESITYRIPGIVSDVSAMLVAMTIFLRLLGENTRC